MGDFFTLKVVSYYFANKIITLRDQNIFEKKSKNKKLLYNKLLGIKISFLQKF